MRYTCTSLMFLAIGITLLPAQSGSQLVLGFRVFPTINKQDISGGSVSYYLPAILGQAWGVKANFTTNSVGSDAPFMRLTVANVDVVRRFKLNKSAKTDWTLDGGISFAKQWKHILPFEYDPYCGVGLTPEVEAESRRIAAEGTTEVNNFAGFALSTSWTRKLGKHWGLGLDLMCNPYVNLTRKPEINLYFIPTILVAYEFSQAKAPEN